MSDQEMKNIWLSSDDGDRINLDLPHLLASLKGKMKKIDRVLFFRDAREIVAALIVMMLFGYKSIAENSSLVKIVNVLVVVWSIYVIYRLLGVRKYKKISDVNATLKAQLAQQKIYLQEQAYLLDSALLWYILPPAFLGMMSILGRSYYNGFNWGTILLSLVVITVFSWGIYVMNKRASRTAYRPLIENIDNVLVQLDEDNL